MAAGSTPVSPFAKLSLRVRAVCVWWLDDCRGFGMHTVEIFGVLRASSRSTRVLKACDSGFEYDYRRGQIVLPEMGI